MSHNKGSDKSKTDLYDSGRADSGFISGAITSESLFSGEISPDESHDADIRPSRSQPDIGEEISKKEDYLRLDSGVDVDLSDQMSGITIDDVQTPSIEIDLPVLHHAHNIDESSWQYYFEQDDEGDTQLHIAIIHRFTEVVFNLVRSVPSPEYLNIRNDGRQTALHLAVLTSQPQVIRRLIVAGGDPGIVDCKGNTPLHLATEAGDLACVRALTEKVELQEVHRAQLRYKPTCPRKIPSLADMVNYEGLTVVHLAVLKGHIGILKYLVKCGADIDAREGKGGRTVLHMAAESSNSELAVFLLRELMAEPNMPNYAGLTAYHVGRRNPQFLKTLLDYGVHADPDYFSSDDDDDEEEDDIQFGNGFRDQFQGRLINAA